MDETSRPVIKKNRATDVILVLKIIDGKLPLNSLGVMDKRLFDGGNRMHVIQDTQTSLWYFKYDFGAVPEVLKMKFTNFTAAIKHVEQYLAKRNVKIEEIID